MRAFAYKCHSVMDHVRLLITVLPSPANRYWVGNYWLHSSCSYSHKQICNNRMSLAAPGALCKGRYQMLGVSKLIGPYTCLQISLYFYCTGLTSPSLTMMKTPWNVKLAQQIVAFLSSDVKRTGFLSMSVIFILGKVTPIISKTVIAWIFRRQSRLVSAMSSIFHSSYKHITSP